MTLLAIDSSSRTCGLALYDGLHVRYEFSWQSRDFHSIDLAPAILRALEMTGVKMADLKAIAVAIGPGSYTGLRISLALAKGLAFAHGLNLVAVPTLDILAGGQPVQDLSMVAVLQAGRARLAVGWYEAKKGAWVAKGGPISMTVQELVELIHKPTLICGELEEGDRAAIGRKYKNAILASPAWSLRRPALLAELAWCRWQAGDIDKAAGLSPIYLQAAGVPV
jgi:tRNA threonylcarbamoyladenosine biosynthesis protein TsaB